MKDDKKIDESLLGNEKNRGGNKAASGRVHTGNAGTYPYSHKKTDEKRRAVL